MTVFCLLMNKLIQFIFISLWASPVFSCKRVMFLEPVSDVSSIVDEKSDYDRLREKIVDYFMQNPTDSLIKYVSEKQTEGGAYLDLDYESEASVYNSSLKHLERLISLSCAYVNPLNSYYQNETLYLHIKKGLRFYYDSDPLKNEKTYIWYGRVIAEPNYLGKIFLNMKSGPKQLPDELVNNYLTRLESQGGKPSEQTSANTTDVAMNRLLLSVLKEDSDILKDALYYLFDPVKYSDDTEGFQRDGSYTFHGRQFYIGGYGEVVLSNVLPVACWVKGTEFEMSNEKVELLRKFMLNTFASVIRGRVMNFNALGRSVSREDYLLKTDIRCEFLRLMTIIDEKFRTEYEAASARIKGKAPAEYLISPKNTCYYLADYMQHQRPKWAVGLRTWSTRTIRQEIYARENLFGCFGTDGSTAITVTGEEYGNIMPLWDWNHIPGVTAPIMVEIPAPPNTYGTSNFTGGVSDGVYGVYTYNYNDAHPSIMTSAKKSWFFLDQEMVCLGADIKGQHQTHTTIDQNWGVGTVEICLKDNRETYNNVEVYHSDKISYVVHNNTGYYFPNGGHVVVEKKEKQGSWHDINLNQSGKIISGDVFKLYLDHQYPDDKLDSFSNNYEYIVCPSKSSSDMDSYLTARHLCITNTDSVQAVIDLDEEIAEVVFYTPSTFKYKDVLNITTTKPCALLIRNFIGKGTLYVADLLRDKQDFVIDIKFSNNTKRFLINFASTPDYYGETNHYDINGNITSLYNSADDSYIPSIIVQGNKVYIKCQGLKMGAIYTLSGKQIKSVNTDKNVFFLPSGCYLIKLDGEGWNYSKKVII